MANRNATKIRSLSQATKLEMINFWAFYKKVADIHTDKELIKRFPQLKRKISTIFKRQQLIVKTNSEIKSYDFNTVGNGMIVFSKKDTKTLCLLRHIRNSIAHWNINYFKTDNKYFEIQDYNLSGDQTVYGILTKETFLSI